MLAGLIRQAQTQGFQATAQTAPQGWRATDDTDITLIMQRMEQDDRNASALGWRTMWHDGLRLGMGFHRMTSQPAGQSAILYTPEPVTSRLVSKVSSTLKMLDTSEDFQEVVTAGGSVSFEGWGAHASASFSATSKVATKTNTISLCGQVMYRSEPIRVINPDWYISSDPSSADSSKVNPHWAVRLKPDAYELLKTEGPTKFHAEYGSHFVCGYTKGGFMAGYYCLEFNSREEANSMEASVKAGFQGWGASGEAASNFKKETQKLSAQTKTYGEYSGYGWSDSKVPVVVQGPEQLKAALNGLPTDDGQPLEAVLCRYTDIPDYQAAVREYNAAQTAAGKPLDTFEYLKEESYGVLVSWLNKEYLRYYCLRGLLLAEVTAPENSDKHDLLGKLKPWLGQVQQVMDKFGTYFNDPAKATDALKKLEAVLLNSTKDKDVRAAGIALMKELWRADALQEEVATLLAMTDVRPKPGIYKLHPQSKPNNSLDAETRNQETQHGMKGRRVLIYEDNQFGNQFWVLAHFQGKVTLHPHDNHDLYLSTSPTVQDDHAGDKVTVEFNAMDEAQVWSLECAIDAKRDPNAKPDDPLAYYYRLRLPGSGRYLTVTKQDQGFGGLWVNTADWPHGGDQDATLWRLQWVQGTDGTR